MHVNFITLKWGTKYGPEYVNRLYWTLLNIYSGPFTFYCFTDDNINIDKRIVIRDIKDLRPQSSSCFTIEKIYLFDYSISKISGNNVLLDLDILITKDLYPYLQNYNFVNPRFIINSWSNKQWTELYAKKGKNYINSSFVTWKNDQLKFIIDFYNENKKVIEFKLNDLDTFLFHGLRDKLFYHPDNLVNSYNNTNNYEILKNYSIILFNTSHGTNRGKELDKATDWANQIWRSHDISDNRSLLL